MGDQRLHSLSRILRFVDFIAHLDLEKVHLAKRDAKLDALRVIRNMLECYSCYAMLWLFCSFQVRRVWSLSIASPLLQGLLETHERLLKMSVNIVVSLTMSDLSRNQKSVSPFDSVWFCLALVNVFQLVPLVPFRAFLLNASTSFSLKRSLGRQDMIGEYWRQINTS